jgi:8-oxo-dGTP pyrophosphatase MutT (NUDIX family)
MEENNKKYLLEEEIVNFSGKYLSLSTKKYSLENDKSKIIKWECVNRASKNIEKKVDGVEIVVVIKNSSEKSSYENLSVILIENYRYPVEKNVLEFPSGIIEDDEREDIFKLCNDINNAKDLDEKLSLQLKHENLLKQIAIKSCQRELKEETGYYGEFKSFLSLPNYNFKIFENIFYDPWKSPENGYLALFEVDKCLEINKNPKQELDDCEIIKTHEVKLNNLLKFISEKIQNENYGCSNHLYTFAMGLQFNEFLKLNNIIS